LADDLVLANLGELGLRHSPFLCRNDQRPGVIYGGVAPRATRMSRFVLSRSRREYSARRSHNFDHRPLTPLVHDDDVGS